MTAFERLALTAGGLGLLRPAPGTWGSLPPAVLAFALVSLHQPIWLVNAALVAFAILFAIACIRFGARGEAMFGKKDPGSVVADEVVGQAITLLGLPWIVGNARHAAICAAIGFIAFRLFDILKPPPANGLQAVPGGLGILLDDVVAAVYAALATQIVVRIFLPV